MAFRSMNDTFGIEITHFGRPFRAGLGVAAPRAKALSCSVLPLRGKSGGLFSQRPRAAASDCDHGVSRFLTKIKVRLVATPMRSGFFALEISRVSNLSSFIAQC